MNRAMAPLPRPRIAPVAPEMIRYPYEAGVPAPVGTGHLHWTITAFGDLDRETGNMRDSVVVEVEAPDEQGAIARAMMVLVRPYYRVSAVRESCSVDRELRGP